MRRRIFLDALRRTANVSAAARTAEMTPRSAYALRQSDTEFRADWESALEEALDELEAELRRRALHGVEKPVFYAGKQCGSFTNYSDQLGMFLLRAHRRQVFDDRQARARSPVPDGDGSARQRLLSLLTKLEDGGDHKK